MVESKPADPSHPVNRQLQQVEGADDIGLDEVCGAADGAIDVRLRGQMNDTGDVVTGKTLLQTVRGTVLEVLTDVGGRQEDRCKDEQVAAVVKTSDIQKKLIRILRNQEQQQVATDKAGPAGDDVALVKSLRINHGLLATLPYILCINTHNRHGAPHKTGCTLVAIAKGVVFPAPYR